MFHMVQQKSKYIHILGKNLFIIKSGQESNKWPKFSWKTEWKEICKKRIKRKKKTKGEESRPYICKTCMIIVRNSQHIIRFAFEKICTFPNLESDAMSKWSLTSANLGNDHLFISKLYCYEIFWGSPNKSRERLFSKWIISYHFGESDS